MPPEIQLTKILSDDDKRQDFIEFCRKTNCEEHIHFFLAIEKFRILKQQTGMELELTSSLVVAASIAPALFTGPLQSPPLSPRTMDEKGWSHSGRSIARCSPALTFTCGYVLIVQPVLSEELLAARAIYDQYLRPGAQREISASPSIKLAIKASLTSGEITSELFDEAQKHVLSILRVDILPKFLGIHLV